MIPEGTYESIKSSLEVLSEIILLDIDEQWAYSIKSKEINKPECTISMQVSQLYHPQPKSLSSVKLYLVQ